MVYLILRTDCETLTCVMGIKKDEKSRPRLAGASQICRRNKIFPKSVNVVSSCLKSTPANLRSIASTMYSAGAAVTSLITRSEEKDRVLYAGFDKLELAGGNVRRVLLLGYVNGFQIFDIEEANNVQELVSKRDSAVAFLQIQPTPVTSEASKWRFEANKPLLLSVKDETAQEENSEYGFGIGYSEGVGGLPREADNNFVSTDVHFYSLNCHNYVHQLCFKSAIYGVRCSSSALAVALATQICCFDPATLEKTFSVLTYPITQGNQVLGGINVGYGPMDVGPRWLAYSPSQALVSDMDEMNSGRLTPVPRMREEKSMKHYAEKSCKKLAAGIVTWGGIGYNKLYKYCSNNLPDSIKIGTVCKDQECSKNGFLGQACDPSCAGMVVVKDLVTKEVVTQFKAHESPISALCFDPSGTLLVTASVHGNNLNVFQIMPFKEKYSPDCNGYDWKASYVHLYKLYRGRTNAIIQDISFSNSRDWIAISSSRGTCHLFNLSPFGGAVCQQNNGHTSMRSGLITVLPWWSIPGSVRENQQPVPPPPAPISLSADSKVKNTNNVWLNAVSDVAAAAAGKTNRPSGVTAVVFHNGSADNKQSTPRNYNDQLWVFLPSGSLIQHVLHPSIEAESISNIPHSCTSCEQSETMELNFSPVQSWDVCRSSNHMEREEYIEVSGDRKEENIESSDGDRKSEDPSKNYWNPLNAEIHTYNRRDSMWSRSQISFHIMKPDTITQSCNYEDNSGGEIDIENIPSGEQKKGHKPIPQLTTAKHLWI